MALQYWQQQSKLSHIWTPTDIPGCKLWLKASQGITLNGSNVSGWNDYSGGNFHASQVEAIRQPLFNASDADFNGKPSMTFDGINDCLRRTNDFKIIGKTISTYIVLKFISGYVYSGIFSIYYDTFDYDTYKSIIVAYNSGTSLNAYRYNINNINPSYMTLNTNTIILSLIDDGANLKTYVNGVYVAQAATNQFYDTQHYVIGARAYDYFSNMKIAETIVYETAVGTTDNTACINYLKAEYGI